MTARFSMVGWLALLLMPIASLSLPARAREDDVTGSDEVRKKQMFPAFDSKCTEPLKGEEFDYPYSVARVKLAYNVAMNGVRRKIDSVNVIVVDNGFVGYQESGFSSNFPEQFFGVRQPVDEILAAPPPNEKDQTLALWGHGTHVVGLVLGGDYDEEKSIAIPPTFVPGVRKLFQRGTDNQSWMSIYVVKVGDENLELGELNALGAKLEKLRGTPAKSQIINMSIIDIDPSDVRSELPRSMSDALFIAAAGNATANLAEIGGRFPAKAKGTNLLVVGSHDANGQLSKFSNYGAKYVEIAAPGCQIRSWLRGEGDATSLDGTSFSTAIVSFAASLLRSLQPEFEYIDLKYRLVLSSSYSEDLLNCKKGSMATVKVTPGEKISPDSGCVRYGSRLDIVAALLADTDMIEYCPNATTSSCRRPTIAYGTLDQVPMSVGQCFASSVPAPSPDELKQPPLALKSNGAIRVTKDGYQTLFLSDNNGIQAMFCPSAEDGSLFVFERANSLDAGNVKTDRLPVDARSVIRVVTRYKL